MHVVPGHALNTLVTVRSLCACVLVDILFMLKNGHVYSLPLLLSLFALIAGLRCSMSHR